VTVGSPLSQAVRKNFEDTASPPAHGDLEAWRNRMAKRGRFTAENGSVVKAMFHMLGQEDMWPEDFPTGLRRRTLNHEYTDMRAGRQMTKNAQIQQLRVHGFMGPVLDDSETLVVATGAGHTQHLVDQASDRLASGLEGSAVHAQPMHAHAGRGGST